ncbi:hypothetical protein KY290_036357 [Solanum tuberosum]|uniref:Reverse transcriptase Ty1/copia-type domain-containing protein n=1 Tax=Solanum tuberosum TaxID=4113 RepID=A0ABQ7TSF9_SOLTU|nr:hypothetical protein KY285_035643 [Solanum tuberosum]KAH0737652.1 hypothetical protein KY290_036357 [Solanum tuberosum]
MNFLLWRTQFLPMIRGYGLEHHLDGTQPIPERFLGENQLNPLYQNWLYTLHRGSDSIEMYIKKSKSIADQLAALQHPINEDDLVEYVKGGLGRGRNRGNGNGKRGRGRGGYFASPSPPGRAFSTSVQTVATNNQFYNRVTQAAPRDNSTISCCNCGGLGHVSRVFHSPRTRNANCGVNKPSSNLASTSSQQSQSWLMDSGPTHHLTANFDNLAIHSEYQGPEEVVLVSEYSAPGPLNLICSDVWGPAPEISNDEIDGVCAVSSKLETSLSLAIPTPHIVPVAHMHPPISQPQPPAIQEPTIAHSPSSVHCSPTKSPSQASPVSLVTPIRNHPMVTRVKTGNLKPKRIQSFSTSCSLALDPTCYTQAFKILEWISAMCTEYNALIATGTWRLVPPHQATNIIGYEDVYMVQPPGFVDPNHPNYIFKLEKSIYALKQAPQVSNKCLTEALCELGFQGSKTDSSLFFRSVGTEKLFCFIYVDDIMGTSMHLVSSYLQQLEM